MSSKQEDHRIYHGTVNAQNRANYEFKYQLIRYAPLSIIGISTVFNFLIKNNWLVAVLSLAGIISSLITYLLLYYLLESAISTNLEYLETDSKNKDMPLNKQLDIDPVSKKKYDDLNKWVRRSYTTSISVCIALIITIGVIQMPANKNKSQKTEVTKPQESNEQLGIVSRPIVPEGNNSDPTPEQPTTGNQEGNQDTSTQETQKPEPKPADGSK
jgi:hypothetical protein